MLKIVNLVFDYPTCKKYYILLWCYSEFGRDIGALLEKRNLQIRILVFNPDNKELLNVYKDYKGESFHYLSWKHLTRFSEHPNTEIKTIDSFVPLALIASDLNTRDGYIRVVHFVNGMNSNSSPNVELEANNEFFDVYKTQIETIWKRGKTVWRSGDPIPAIFDKDFP